MTPIFFFFGVNFMSIISQYPDGWWLCLGRLHEESWQVTGTGVLAVLSEARVSPKSHLLNF